MWRRSDISAERVRTRLVLLAAGVAALATVASSQNLPVKGITWLEIGDDGAVVACPSFPYSCSASYDGGFTWEGLGWTRSDIPQSADKVKSVTTPRGTYSIEDGDVIQSVGDERKMAYSAAYLREESNVRAQLLATGQFFREGATVSPDTIIYDDSSGNVVVAMGLQGVVVGTPDGEWARVAVRDYTPTDFSVASKLQDYGLWLLGAAMAASFAAIVLVPLGDFRKRDVPWAWAGLAMAVLIASWLWVYPLLCLLWSLLLILPVAYPIALTVAFKARSNAQRPRAGVVLIGAGVVLSFLGFAVLNAGSAEPPFQGLAMLGRGVAHGVLGLASASIVVALYLRMRCLWAFLAALAGMLALFGLLVVLWIASLIELWIMVVLSAGLMGTVAFLLRRHIRRSEAARVMEEASGR